MSALIRPSATDDLPAIAAIYAHRLVAELDGTCSVRWASAPTSP